MVGFYVVFNDDARNLALLGGGIGLALWCLRQVYVHRFRGLLVVSGLCAVLAGGAQYVWGSVPIELSGAWLVFASLWAVREIVELLQRLFARAAQRWRGWHPFKRAQPRRPKKLEPATVAVPGRAANVSAEEIIKRLVPKPEQPKAS
jgi:hypothetical protein